MRPAGDLEYPDVLLRQRTIEGGADRVDALAKGSVQRQYDLVPTAVAHEGLRERQRIATDSPVVTLGLGALKIDDDAHQLACFVAAFASRA